MTLCRWQDVKIQLLANQRLLRANHQQHHRCRHRTSLLSFNTRRVLVWATYGREGRVGRGDENVRTELRLSPCWKTEVWVNSHRPLGEQRNVWLAGNRRGEKKKKKRKKKETTQQRCHGLTRYQLAGGVSELAPYVSFNKFSFRNFTISSSGLRSRRVTHFNPFRFRHHFHGKKRTRAAGEWHNTSCDVRI